MLNDGSCLSSGAIQIGNILDRPVPSALAVLEGQGSAEIWWRFGGGSDRNRALLGNSGTSVHVMHAAQSRIKTGVFASR